MRFVPLLIYGFLLLAGSCLGYWSMTPGLINELRPSSASTMMALSFLIIGASILSLRYAHAKGADFRRPSVFRGLPRTFLEDPMQAFFVSTLLAFGVFLGSGLALPASGDYGRRAAAWHLSLLVALLVGQAVGYVLYRQRDQSGRE